MSDPNRVAWDDLDVGAEEELTWNGQPFTGVAEEHDPAGRVRAETEYVMGVRHGPGRVWDERGTLRVEDVCWKGALHGPMRTWHENGRLASECEYSYGIETRRIAWNSEGAPVSTWVLPTDHPARETLKSLEKWAAAQRARG